MKMKLLLLKHARYVFEMNFPFVKSKKKIAEHLLGLFVFKLGLIFFRNQRQVKYMQNRRKRRLRF